MSQPVSLMPDPNSPTAREQHSLPAILGTLPDIPIPPQRGAMKLQQRIDLVLLALEALQLGGSEYMLATARELELDRIVPNRIVLWRLRCSNPWRKCYTRESLTLNQAKTLVIIASYRARQLMVTIRQLLLAEQQMLDKDMPLENNFRLSEYLERFATHFASRMNPRRAKVSIYLDCSDELNELALYLLKELLFCTGTQGMQRFWLSLFDGEIG